MDANRDETTAERFDRSWLDLMIAPCVVMVFHALVWGAPPMSLLQQEGRY